MLCLSLKIFIIKSLFRLPDLPYIPGSDAAGVIEKLGSDVQGLSVGQRVFVTGRNSGTLKILNEKDGETLRKNNIGWRFLKKTIKNNLTEAIFLIKDKKLILCHTCWKYIQKGEMAPICEANGLYLDKIPKELQITDLERQSIARSLLFLTIKEMPTRKCKKMEGRVIHVPLENSGKT